MFQFPIADGDSRKAHPAAVSPDEKTASAPPAAMKAARSALLAFGTRGVK
jgi:hypothetical protein